jgi:hypothetical protein
MLREIDRITRVWQAGEHGLVGVDATTILLEDKDFEISGTNAADGNCTYNAERGLTLTTSSAAADQVAMLPAVGADDISLFREITWGTDRETHFEAVIKTDVLQTVGGIYAVGLLLTFPATFDPGDDNDRVLFHYEETTNTKWMIAVNIGGVDLNIDTGVLVTASTVYHFRIEIDRSKQAYCYINDQLVYVSTALDTVDLLPCVAVEEGNTNPQVVHVQAIAMSRALGA